MIDLEATADGVVLPVKAHAGARKNDLQGVRGGAQGFGHASAERGKANRAIIDLLADRLDLRKGQIELLSGETSPQKRFLIRDISQAALADRLAAVLSDGRAG